jgi:hypothetical protein
MYFVPQAVACPPECVPATDWHITRRAQSSSALALGDEVDAGTSYKAHKSHDLADVEVLEITQRVSNWTSERYLADELGCFSAWRQR